MLNKNGTIRFASSAESPKGIISKNVPDNTSISATNDIIAIILIFFCLRKQYIGQATILTADTMRAQRIIPKPIESSNPTIPGLRNITKHNNVQIQVMIDTARNIFFIGIPPLYLLS